MISVLYSSVVDRGFIDGVMVSVLSSSAVDRGFIDGVMGATRMLLHTNGKFTMGKLIYSLSS